MWSTEDDAERQCLTCFCATKVERVRTGVEYELVNQTGNKRE